MCGRPTFSHVYFAILTGCTFSPICLQIYSRQEFKQLEEVMSVTHLTVLPPRGGQRFQMVCNELLSL